MRGGVHQVASRALENLTGANMIKPFPAPRIPTDKIPECQPHIKRGEHLRVYRFSPTDYMEIRRRVQRPAPRDGRAAGGRRPCARGRAAARPAAAAGLFTPDYAPEEIAEIALKLRKAAGLGNEPTGVVAEEPGVVRKVADKLTP